METGVTVSLMKAGQVKTNLEAIALLGDEQAGRVHAAIAPATRERIERASRIEWLALDDDVELTTAVFREVGADGLRAWSLDAIVRSTKTGLLGPLLQGVINVFGVHPRSILRAAPRVWASLYKGCGSLRVVDVDAATTELVLEGAPAAMVTPPYSLGIAASAEAAIVLTRFDGTVGVEDARPRAGSARFVARWRERRAAP